MTADLGDLRVDWECEHIGVQVIVTQSGNQIGSGRAEAAVARRTYRHAHSRLGVEIDVAHVVAEQHDGYQSESGCDFQRRQLVRDPFSDRAARGDHG